VVDYTYILKGTRAPGLTYMPAAATLDTLAQWKITTQEVRLQSNHADSSNSFLQRLTWVIGAFWLKEERDNWQSSQAPGWSAAAPSSQSPLANDIFSMSDTTVEDASDALFVDVTFNITDELVVGAGIRYFDMSSDSHGQNLPGVPATPTVPVITDRSYQEDGHTPKVFAQYSMSDDLMVYSSYAEGFRLGGSTAPIDFNTRPECLPVVTDNGLMPYAQGKFFSDSVETTEIGVKSGFLNGRITANFSAYHTDWSDLQQQIRLTGFPGSLCTQVLTANVGSAKVDGAELEFSALATDSIALSATLSYTDARIVDPGPGSALAKPGDTFPNVPEWSGSFMADYSIPTSAFGGSTFFLHGVIRYMSETSPLVGKPANPELELPAYSLVGIRGGFTFGENPTTVTLFVNNVFDEYARMNARGRVGVPADIWVTPAMPRTVGITVRKDF
jgi:iron complex outermembrane receptor protein